jgi:hypothetical protein
MPPTLQLLLLIWGASSAIGIFFHVITNTKYIFRTAIIGYMGGSTQGSNMVLVDAIDDLGNKLTLMMKKDVAENYKVGDTITVTVPQ